MKQSWQVYTTQFNIFLLIIVLLALPFNMVLDFTEDYSPFYDQEWLGTADSGDLTSRYYYDEEAELDVAEFRNLAIAEYFTQKFQEPWTWVNVIAEILSLVVSVIAGNAIVIAAARAFKKKKIVFSEVLKQATRLWFPVVLTSALMVLLLMPLYVLLIIPGVIFTMFWVFTSQVIILENKRYWKALQRSRDLVRGNWMEVFGRYVLLALILTFIMLVLMGATSLLMEQVKGVQGIVVTIFQVISVYMSVFIVVYYYDLRDRLKQQEKKEKERKKAAKPIVSG